MSVEPDIESWIVSISPATLVQENWRLSEPIDPPVDENDWADKLHFRSTVIMSSHYVYTGQAQGIPLGLVERTRNYKQ